MTPCQICRGLVPGEKIPDTTFEAVLTSRKECANCTILCEIFENGSSCCDCQEQVPQQFFTPVNQDNDSIHFEVRCKLNPSCGPTDIWFTCIMTFDVEIEAKYLLIKSEVEQGVKHFANHCTTISRQENTPGLKSQTQTDFRNTRSTTSFKKVLEWIADCTSNHDQCGDGSPSRLPTRVIDVVKCSPNVVLVEPNNQIDRYVCLSHCWGNAQFIVTNKENLDKHKEKILFKSLSQTFQDAVKITRKLGVRYIWIDSLCIVQNWQTDWEIESTEMARIYQNSFLTISATKSWDSNGGLFSRQLDIKTAGLLPDGRSFHTSCYQPLDHARPDLPFSIIDTTPLLQRGWAYQERILSPRVLHFCSFELVWECWENDDCECGSFAESARLHSKSLYSIHPEKTQQPNFGSTWRQIISEYSEKLLTYPSDKLPALSGLAQREHLIRPEEMYLAGLWSGTLIYDLMWSSQWGRQPRTTTTRAPSWSWASLDGPIFFFDIPRIMGDFVLTFVRCFARLLDAKCESKSMDLHGEVSGGYVSIASRVITAHIKYDPLSLEVGTTLIPQEKEFEIPFHGFSLDCVRENPNFRLPDSHLYLLQVAHIEDELKPGFAGVECGKSQYEVSLLLICIDPESKTFKRVGILGWEGTLFDQEDDETEILIM